MESLEQIRIQKLQQIKTLGFDPYPTYYRFTHTLAEAAKEFSAKTAEELEHEKHKVRVAGRILTNRPFGKAGFITLSDGEGQLQVYVKKDQVAESQQRHQANNDQCDYCENGRECIERNAKKSSHVLITWQPRGLPLHYVWAGLLFNI